MPDSGSLCLSVSCSPDLGGFKRSFWTQASEHHITESFLAGRTKNTSPTCHLVTNLVLRGASKEGGYVGVRMVRADTDDQIMVSKVGRGYWRV